MWNLLMLCPFETASIIFSYQGCELLPACLFIHVPDDGIFMDLWQKACFTQFSLFIYLFICLLFNDTEATQVKPQRAQWLLFSGWLWISHFHTQQPLKRLQVFGGGSKNCIYCVPRNPVCTKHCWNTFSRWHS